MSWFSGTGLARMLQGIIGNSDFQRAAFDATVELGKKLIHYASSPDKVRAIGQNLVGQPEVFVGAQVAGTAAEKLVDPKVVADAKDELSKPDH